MTKTKKSGKQTGSEGMSHRIFDEVIDLASTLFRSRKAAAADQLHTLAKATQKYAAEMTDLPMLQRQVKLASDNMVNFAEYVTNTDIKHMVSDATVLAQRRPMVTLGVAAAAGLAATRLMTTPAISTARTARRRAPKKARKVNTVARRTMNGSIHADA